MAPPELAKKRRIAFVQNDRTRGGRLMVSRFVRVSGGNFLKICEAEAAPGADRRAIAVLELVQF